MSSPADDARRLREAMKGIGTNDSVLIDIIGHRSREQRMMIVAEYKNVIGRDLLKDLEAETSGHYREVLLYLMKPRAEVLADLLHRSMAGAGTNDALLIDLLTQFPYELPAAAATYQAMFKKGLEAAVRDDTSGNLEKLLCNLIIHPRPAPHVADAARASADAEILYRAGEGKIGTDESAFINVMSTNSYQQLALIDQAYRTSHKKGLELAIKSETSGKFRDALVALVTPPDMYFARRIKESIEGAGTKDIDLIACFVCNERPQLQMISQAYERLYGTPMAKAVGSDISGDYKKILMALL